MLGWAVVFMFPGYILASILGDENPTAGTIRWLAAMMWLAFLSVRFAFTTCVPVFERVGGGAGYLRNLKLLSGRFWQIAGPVGLLAVVYLVGTDLLTRFLPTSLGNAASSLWQCLMAPLEVAVAVMLYRQIRTEEAAASQAVEGSAPGGDLGRA
jgi:hypothetical protein